MPPSSLLGVLTVTFVLWVQTQTEEHRASTRRRFEPAAEPDSTLDDKAKEALLVEQLREVELAIARRREGMPSES